MIDPGYSSQHTMTTVTSTTTVQPTIRFDSSYVKLQNIPGILKIAQLVLNLLGFICVMSSHLRYSGSGSWFNTVALTGFWVTLILLLMYLFHIIERFYYIPWLSIEFFYTALWTLFYFIAATVCATYAPHDDAFAAASFFGFAAMVIYGIDAFLKWKAWRSGQLAQGARVISKTTSTVQQPPGY